MTVTGCDDCPLEYDSWRCHHPDGGEKIGEHVGKGTAPDWCPLRKAPLTLALECPACKRGRRGEAERLAELAEHEMIFGRTYECAECHGAIPFEEWPA